MKINKFDRSNLRTLREELDELLSKFSEARNIEISIGKISYTDSELSVKLGAKVKGGTTRADRMLDLMIQSYGLVKEKNGAVLVEYNSRNHRYPFIYEKNGKRYKTEEARAKIMFSA